MTTEQTLSAKLDARPATFTCDKSKVGPLYYFAVADRAPGPYKTQRHVEAIIDIADDGTLAGVELIDSMPPPPLAQQALRTTEDGEVVAWVITSPDDEEPAPKFTTNEWDAYQFNEQGFRVSGLSYVEAFSSDRKSDLADLGAYIRQRDDAIDDLRIAEQKLSRLEEHGQCDCCGDIRHAEAELNQPSLVSDGVVDALRELMAIVEIHSQQLGRNFAWAEMENAATALSALEHQP